MILDLRRIKAKGLSIIIKHPLRIWQQVELVARQHQQHRCPPAAVGLGLLLPHRQTRSKWPKNTIYYQPPSRRSSFSTAIGSPRDQGLYYSSSEAHGAERLSSPTCSCQFTSATWSYSISTWGETPNSPSPAPSTRLRRVKVWTETLYQQTTKSFDPQLDLPKAGPNVAFRWFFLLPIPTETVALEMQSIISCKCVEAISRNSQHPLSFFLFCAGNVKQIRARPWSRK